MKNIFVTALLSAMMNTLFSQVFPHGTNAIHKDSSIIISWAVSAEVERGYINISDTSLTYTENGITSNKAFYGNVINALGPADGTFVSLGDGGNIILQFNNPITNGEGYDFVVFENAFFSPPNQYQSAFAELAFVEVSTDGINYERFPAISLQQTDSQVGSFQASDISLFSNFAGIYPVFYGVPFDLDDIPGIIVDKNLVRYVRIIDAVGCINPQYASYDYHGNIVNDPWPTPFASCGFDLDAVGVINQLTNVSKDFFNDFIYYPNPVKEILNITALKSINLEILDLTGKIFYSDYNISGHKQINLSNLYPGQYFLSIYSNNSKNIYKLIKIE